MGAGAFRTPLVPIVAASASAVIFYLLKPDVQFLGDGVVWQSKLARGLPLVHSVALVAGCTRFRAPMVLVGVETYIAWQRAVDASPRNGRYLRGLALAAERIGMVPEARATWERLLDVYPDNQEAKTALSRLGR